MVQCRARRREERGAFWEAGPRLGSVPEVTGHPCTMLPLPAGKGVIPRVKGEFPKESHAQLTLGASSLASGMLNCEMPIPPHQADDGFP